MPRPRVLLAVLDTNILVSAALTPLGSCGEVLRQLEASAFRVAYDVRIMAEYAEVLARPHFHQSPQDVAVFLGMIEGRGQRVTASRRALALPHEDDRAFVEVAMQAGADFLVTGNQRHYPAQQGQTYTVLGPKGFLDVLAR